MSTVFFVVSTLNDECSTLITTPTSARSSITMSWSSNTPSRSSPAETSAHSWTWIARTSTSWCVRSEKIVSVVP